MFWGWCCKSDTFQKGGNGKIMGFAIQIKFNPLGSYVLGILGNSRYAMWVNSYDASISNHLLKKPWFRENRWLGHDLSVRKGRADTWMCVFKVSASSGLLHLLQCRAFHSSLRDDMHYGPKVLDFPGLFHQPETLNPTVHGLTSILASVPREGTLRRE